MSITAQANARVTVTRMTGTTKKTLTSVGVYDVMVAPLADEVAANQFAGLGKTFEIYTEELELEEGDRLDDGTKVYVIGGIQTYRLGSRPYSRIIATHNA
jgi:hypothetical protein